jgi:hypothetical protein
MTTEPLAAPRWRRVFALGVISALVGLAACTTTTETSTNPATDAVSDIPVNLLHDRLAAALAVRDIEKDVPIETAMVRSISVYDTYLIMEVQDPGIPEHLDQYTWRDGVVEPPEPVHLSGPQEDVDASLYPTSAVNLGELSHIVKKSERRLERAEPIRIEEARASYLFIERSSSLDGRVTIRISISGPRRSGNVETTASGEILNATVS